MSEGAATGDRQAWWAVPVRGVRKGVRTCVFLVKVVFPVYILVNWMKDSGLLAEAAAPFVPLMRFLGLPGEAALAIIAGNLGNIYAGLAVAAPLGLAPRQVTILGLVLGLSHSLLIEAAVFQRMGASPVRLSLFRFGISLAAGAGLSLVLPA